MLLNLSPLPANVSSLPAPEAPATVNAGFQAVMSRQYDSAPTFAGAGPGSMGAATGSGMAAEEAVGGEVAADADDLSGVEALIGEMLQRQEIAAPGGNGAPLVAALESLADALTGLAELVADPDGNAPVADPDPLAVDVAAMLPGAMATANTASLAGEVAAPALQPVVAAADRLAVLADGAPTGVQQVIRDVTALLEPWRQAFGQVDPGLAAKIPVGEAQTGQLQTTVPADATGILPPADATLVDPASLPAPDTLESMIATLRAQAGSLVTTGMVAGMAGTQPLVTPAMDAVVEVELGLDEVLPVADKGLSATSVAAQLLRNESSQLLPAEAAGSPESVEGPGAEQLLDPGFELVADTARPVRDSAGRDLLPDAAVRLVNSLEGRSPGADTTPELVTPADRAPNVAEPRNAVATGKADVWMQQPTELPEHILHHVGRLHAQSIRLHAAGFTDLVQRLTLSLHPEDLGQVDVQMRTGEQLSLTFLAREGATRDLLEQNLPRLRQLFEAQGLSLGDVNVGAGNAQARQEGGGQRDAAGNAVAAGTARTSGGSPAPRVPAQDRLIDIRA